MDKTSALGQALEQETYHNRRTTAINAWAAAGNPGRMPLEWQELYECTLLDEEQLERAIVRRIVLLQGEIKENDLRQKSDNELLGSLKQQLKVPTVGTISIGAEDIKNILMTHYRFLANSVGRTLDIEITMSTDPITDEIWANVDYNEK